MKTLIGGVVAAVLGIVGLTLWFGEFWVILKGAIPIMLLLGGALAIYLGFDELKDSWKSESTEDSSSFGTGAADTGNTGESTDDSEKTDEAVSSDSGDDE